MCSLLALKHWWWSYVGVCVYACVCKTVGREHENGKNNTKNWLTAVCCVFVCMYSGMIIDITHPGPIVANQHKLVPSLVLCKIIHCVWDYPKEEASSAQKHTQKQTHTERKKRKRRKKWRERAGMRDRYGTMSWIFFFISRDIFYMQSESVYSPLTDSYFSAECITLNCTSPCYLAFDEGKWNTQSECESVFAW